MSTPQYFFGEPDNMGRVSRLPATTFKELIETFLAQPVPKAMTREQFFALPKEGQKAAKRTKYIVPCAFKEDPSPRQTGKATDAHLLCLDIDDPQEALRMLSIGVQALLGDLNALVWHTASSTPAAPRLRVVVPVEAVPISLYRQVVTSLAARLGIASVNSESKVPVQPMYLPVQFEGSTTPVIYCKTNGVPFGSGNTATQIETRTGGKVDLHGPANVFVDGLEYIRPTDEEVSLKLAEEMVNHLDPDMGRAEWIKVAMGLRHQFPEEAEGAYRIFDRWSERSASKYGGAEDTRAVWDSIVPNPSTREPITIGSVKALAMAAGWSPTTVSGLAWGPLRFPDPPSPPDFDLDKGIPDSLIQFRDFLRAASTAMQVDVTAVAPLALSVVSAAAARTYEVRLRPDWVEIVVLWVVALAEPGERKSAVIRRLTAPITAWQDNERRRLRPAIAKYEAQRGNDAARHLALRKKLATCKPGERQQIDQELHALVAKMEVEPEIHPPDLVTADFTPEAARQLLIRNGGKLSYISAETDFGTLTGSRYAAGGAGSQQNLNLLLAGKSGDNIPAHRVGRSEPLARPCLNIGIFVQPSAVRDVLLDGNTNGRGLVQRFALIVPSSLMGSRLDDPPAVPVVLEDWWNSAIARILDVPWPGKAVLDSTARICRHELGPIELELDAAAIGPFQNLRSAIEKRCGVDGDLRPIAGFASKLAGEVARIAACLELLQNPQSESVSGQSMVAACYWSEFLIGHHRAALGAAGESAAVRHARRLISSLRRNGTAEEHARELFRRVRNGTDLAKMADFQPVLEELCLANCIRRKPNPSYRSSGRPPEIYEINPALWVL
jgi:hypothetical protein